MNCITIQGMKRDPAVDVSRIDSMMERRGWGPGELQYQSGVTYDTIYKIRTSNRPRTSAEILGKLAVALGCSVDWLIGITDDPRPTSEILGKQKTLAAVSDQGLELLGMLEQLPAGDQAVVNGLIRHLDEKRKSVERLQVALELVEVAGRLGGEGARAVALRIMNDDLPLSEALAELGESADSSILPVGGS